MRAPKTSPRRLLLLLLILLPCVGCDQASKALARSYLTPGAPVEHLGGCLTLTLAENPGAFLGLGSRLPAAPRRAFVVGVVALLLTALAAWLVLSRPLRASSFLVGSLVLGGGIGNLVDRLLLDGRVTDFLLLRAGPLQTGVFNLADVLITCSPVILLWSSRAPRRARPETPG